MACPDLPSLPTIDPRYTRFRLRIAPSRIHRWGIYAEERIPANRKVIEYTGEKISRRESKRRADSRPEVYLFSLDNYWNIDGSVNGSGAEYINHCCEPNLAAHPEGPHSLHEPARDRAGRGIDDRLPVRLDRGESALPLWRGKVPRPHQHQGVAFFPKSANKPDSGLDLAAGFPSGAGGFGPASASARATIPLANGAPAATGLASISAR